jgi:hypothetical protein
MNLHLLHSQDLSVNLMSLSLLVDLVFWVPLIYHFAIARSGLGPKFLTKILFSVGLLSTIYLVPQGSFLSPLVTYYPYLALSVIGVIAILGIKRFIPAFFVSKNMSIDNRIAFIANETAGSNWFASVLKTEWTAIYYGIFGWRLRRSANNETEFSYHIKSGNVGLLIGLSIFQLPSLIFTHIIFHNISPVTAIVLTIAHIYTLYFGLSQAMAMKNRYVCLSDDKLHLKCGLMFDTAIPLSRIKRISRISALDAEQEVEDRVKATFFGFANVKIELNESTNVPVFSGLSKACTEIIIGLDEPVKFCEQVKKEIELVSERKT